MGRRVHFHIISLLGLHAESVLSFTFVLLAASPQKHTVMFDTLEDWRGELERTRGNMKYKAVSVNEGYRVCER